MLFSTGYTAVYTYTQTHLHDLLVANYTLCPKINVALKILQKNQLIKKLIKH